MAGKDNSSYHVSYETYVSEELTFVWCLLVVALLCSYLVLRHRVNALPPAGAAMLVGMVGGGILVALKFEGDFRFDNSIFFYGLLPPIIYHAGASTSKTRLWKNLGSILTFAVVGTFVSTIVVGGCLSLLMSVGAVRSSTFGTALSAAEAARVQTFLPAPAPPAPPQSPNAQKKSDLGILECFMYGSLVSATDPVSTLAVFSSLGAHPMVHSIVLGESIMNDAVAIVLFRALEKMHAQVVEQEVSTTDGAGTIGWGTIFKVFFSFVALLLGSVFVGVVSSLLVAFLLKRMELWRYTARSYPGRARSAIGSGDARAYEMGVLLFGAYASYLFAELVDLSGITALFFAGIFHSHYAHANVSRVTRESMHVSLGTAAHCCETFVFAYLGLQIATWKQHQVDLGFLLSALPICMLARAVNIYPLSLLINTRRHTHKRITGNMQHMLWLAGLRGAVAYALCVNFPPLSSEYVSVENPNNPYVESTTLFLIVTTTLLFGGSTGPMLKHFGLLETSSYDNVGGRGIGGNVDGEPMRANDDEGEGHAMLPLGAELGDVEGATTSRPGRTKKTNGGGHHQHHGSGGASSSSTSSMNVGVGGAEDAMVAGEGNEIVGADIRRMSLDVDHTMAMGDEHEEDTRGFLSAAPRHREDFFSSLHSRWRKFDYSFMKPIFGGSGGFGLPDDFEEDST
ncbi:sodium/hydrogen exchanger [Pycnococcus provasolii]